MPVLRQFQKDPSAVLDFIVNWTDYLDGDTISTAAATVPAGITLDSEANTTTTHTMWLSGGTEGNAYDIVSQIVTVGGRTDERTIRINVVNL